MLAAQSRIRTSQQFADVISNGVKVVEPGAIIYVLENTSEHDGQAGFIVSKAIGNAVKRNAVKRKYRAIVAKHLQPQQKIVVRARPIAGKFTFQELEEQYLHALKKAEEKGKR